MGLQLLKAEHQKNMDWLTEKECVLKSSSETKGMHPYRSITFPTSESGLTFYLNEEAVVAAMKKESTQRYSLVQNNCATSVKRCFLAGIEHLKNDLPPGLYKLEKMVTCTGLANWVKKLDTELILLNYPRQSERQSICR